MNAQSTQTRVTLRETEEHWYNVWVDGRYVGNVHPVKWGRAWEYYETGRPAPVGGFHVSSDAARGLLTALGVDFATVELEVLDVDGVAR